MTNHKTVDQTIQTISSSPPTQWVQYLKYETTGEQVLDIPEQYAALLVLEGEITLWFKGYESKNIGHQSLVVIDREQIKDFKPLADTAILAFTPPKKIFRFFRSCCKAFSLPCSPIVPILPELQQWADELIAEQLRPKEELTDVCQRNYCMRLMNILNDYPPLLVGELLVAFQACAMSGEKRCRHGACK